MTDARRRTDPSEIPRIVCARASRGRRGCLAPITTGVPILHPQIFLSVKGLLATRQGHYRASTIVRGRVSRPHCQNSPIGIAYEGNGPVRCDLSAPPENGEFVILDGSCAVKVLPITSCTRFRSPTAATERFRSPPAVAAASARTRLALFEAMIPAVAPSISKYRRCAITTPHCWIPMSDVNQGAECLKARSSAAAAETIQGGDLAL